MEESNSLYSLLKESFLLLDFGDRQLFERFGLTVSRYYALHHISLAPGISPSRLSTLMFCDKSNITRLLHSLEADGAIERRSHEHDGRAQRLFLTDTGAMLHERVSREHGTAVERRLGVLDHNERKQLLATLRELNQTLTNGLQQLPKQVV